MLENHDFSQLKGTRIVKYFAQRKSVDDPVERTPVEHSFYKGFVLLLWGGAGCFLNVSTAEGSSFTLSPGEESTLKILGKRAGVGGAMLKSNTTN